MYCCCFSQLSFFPLRKFYYCCLFVWCCCSCCCCYCSWVLFSFLLVYIFIYIYVGSCTRTECSRWPWEVRRCFGRDEELDVVTRARTECPRWPWEVHRCFGRDEELNVVTRTRTECPRWPWEVRRCFGQNEELEVYRAVSGSVRPDGCDVSQAFCSQLASRLAGSRSLTFRWVELLDHTDCGARFIRFLYSAG
jgi:hypothetical protein